MNFLKNSMYLIIFASFLGLISSCQEESKPPKNKLASPQTTDTTEVAKENKKPKERKEEIRAEGEVSKYNIEDYYNLWLRTETQNRGQEFDEADHFTKTDHIKDIPNGYMKVSHVLGIMGYHTFTLWKAKNGKVTLGVLEHGCGPACKPYNIQFYEIKDKKLLEVTEDIFPETQQIELNKKARNKYKDQQDNGQDYMKLAWKSLPRTGTDIQIGLAKTGTFGTNPEQVEYIDLMAELKYNQENGTFTFTEK